jgi:glucose-6-phosphate 1-dehydrogenase
MKIVIVGGTGDLSRRMLLPALYFLDAEGLLAPEVEVIGLSRLKLDRDGFRDMALTALKERAGADFDADVWARFRERIDYIPADLTETRGAETVKARIGATETIFYLSVSPSLFDGICVSLKAAGLTDAPNRIVLEKPIGRDGRTSAAINTAVANAFAEDRTYRIDHYLGKETVQNLIALRFANALFEPLWNGRSIDHVQITVAETEGVGDRWPYYDDYGALRDMLQNHMLQLLCLVAMEPPASLDPDSVRNEKVKILRSLRPIGPGEIAQLSVRGQYRAGVAAGKASGSYVEECGKITDTETYVALCAHIDNWRWAGVPFLMRTGKRMAEKRTQIVIQFKPVPHSIFPGAGGGDVLANKLVIDLQPDEDISLLLMNKTPGLDRDGFRLSPLPLSLSLATAFGGGRRRIAYERLLMDVIHNNSTLFVRRDEVEASWAWIDGIRASWADAGVTCRPYDAGGWGPVAAYNMIAQLGRSWNE